MYFNIDPFVFDRPNTMIDVSQGKVLISTGFGCDPTYLHNVRLLAYLVPAIEMAKGLKERGVESVRIEYYFAQHFVAWLRGEGQRVGLWTDTAMALLRGYLASFYPDVDTHVLRDRPLLPEEEDIIDEMACYLQKRATREVKEFANKRGGFPALRYMAAHAMYMWDPLQILAGRPSLRQGGIEAFDSVIMIGGRAEKIFYEARQTLMGFGTHSRWESRQLFTNIGRGVPCYHHTAEEPVVSRDLPKDFLDLLSGMDKNIRRDLTFLMVNSLGDGRYERVDRVGGFPSADQVSLQSGWDMVRLCLMRALG